MTLLVRKRSRRERVVERRARHELHDQEVEAVLSDELVHRPDVRLIQLGQRHRFGPEPAARAVVRQEPGLRIFNATSRSSCSSWGR
jgi:hypothetical protein